MCVLALKTVFFIGDKFYSTGTSFIALDEM
jgi:hypothetical protein